MDILIEAVMELFSEIFLAFLESKRTPLWLKLLLFTIPCWLILGLILAVLVRSIRSRNPILIAATSGLFLLMLAGWIYGVYRFVTYKGGSK